MGETIDLNDLNNIEENFENVKLFGGGKFKKGVRDLRPGAFVIYKDNRKWEVVKFDDKDARYLFIRREGEEDKRVYNGDVVMYRDPPESSEEEEFSPKSPPLETRFSDGDEVLYKDGVVYIFKRYDGENAEVFDTESSTTKMVNPKDLIPVDKRGARDNLSFSPKSPDGKSSFPTFKVGEYVLYLAEKHRVKSKDGKYYNIINEKTGEEKRVWGTSIMTYNQRFFAHITDKLEVGLKVLNAGEIGTIKKIEGRKITIINDKNEEKTVDKGNVIIYEPPDVNDNLSFSPKSPDGPPPPDSPEPERGRALPGFVRAKRPDPLDLKESEEELSYSPKSPPLPDDFVQGPRTPDGPPPDGPRSPDEPPRRFQPRSPDEPPPDGPRTPDEPPRRFQPRSPDDGPRTPDGPPPKSPQLEISLAELLETVKRENLPQVELIKGEELIEDRVREETGVFRATNKLLSNMMSSERTDYLNEYNTLYSIIKKPKRGESFTESQDTLSYTRNGETCTIKKPVYRNVNELINRLSFQLEKIEYKLKELRDSTLLMKKPDPKSNRELQELDKLHNVYTLSLSVYKEYYEKLNSINDKRSRIKELKMVKNSNRLRQRVIFSQIGEELNSRRINDEKLNSEIREYLKLSNTHTYPEEEEEDEGSDTTSIEEKIRLLNEELENNLESAVIIVQSEITRKKSGDAEKPAKVKIMKKKSKGKKKKDTKKGGAKKKNGDELLSQVIEKLNEVEETEVEEEVEEEVEGESNEEINLELLAEENNEGGELELEEIIEENMGSESVVSDDINLQKSIETALQVNEVESESEQTGGDPEIKTIVIKPSYSGSDSNNSNTNSDSDNGVEELELSDDINELISDQEFENYSFEDSYQSGSDEEGDSNIPLNLNLN